MTPPTSEGAGPEEIRLLQPFRRLLALLRGHWRLTVAGVILLAVLVGGVIALAYRQGFFVRGPAADAATAFLTDVQHRNYAAAYALLTPDLRAKQTEQAFAAAVDGIRQSDGPLKSFSARELNSGSGGATVVGFEVTRAIRGTFAVHISLVQDKTGHWLISGIDDL